MWFIGVEVEQDTSAPPPKKNPGSAPIMGPKLVVKFPSMSIIAIRGHRRLETVSMSKYILK